MAGSLDKPGRAAACPLGRMPSLSLAHLEVLKSRWIRTIDAFVAAAAIEDGREGLCKALGVEPKALDNLLQEARDVLGEERYLELTTPRPGGPTGALWEEKDHRQTADGSATEDREQ